MTDTAATRPMVAAQATGSSATTAAAIPDRASAARGADASARPKVVVYDTSVFLLTTAINLNAPEQRQVFSWSECVTPADDDNCCWQWLTACNEDDQDCEVHVAHGCYVDLDAQ